MTYRQCAGFCIRLKSRLSMLSMVCCIVGYGIGKSTAFGLASKSIKAGKIHDRQMLGGHT